MKLLSAAVGKKPGEVAYNVIGIVFLSPNEGAEDLYDSLGYRLTIYRPTEMTCAAGRMLESFDDIVKFGEAIDNWATEHVGEPVRQGIGISADRIQIVDFDDGSLIMSMKFEAIEYQPNIDMRGARKEEQE